MQVGKEMLKFLHSLLSFHPFIVNLLYAIFFHCRKNSHVFLTNLFKIYILFTLYSLERNHIFHYRSEIILLSLSSSLLSSFSITSFSIFGFSATFFKKYCQTSGQVHTYVIWQKEYFPFFINPLNLLLTPSTNRHLRNSILAI